MERCLSDSKMATLTRSTCLWAQMVFGRPHSLPSPDKILRIPNFPDAVTFWHGPKDWVYTCNLNNNIYEVTTMAEVSGEVAKVSWGEDATLEELRKPYKAVLYEVKEVKRFALFAGPRLSTVISRGSIALIGDASHPYSLMTKSK
ncbi:hypothetical protein N7449_004216 [Penicillium cf. viridicatum]|uniref:Uncharacterized protein n=1 Tax=Penicillium cf. viridicatum TaxID=2972119 RepID=A0A9W9T544_9EURO|nr:hypothetical protein N7449_004216 [Penicillium cf. viridicatum]